MKRKVMSVVLCAAVCLLLLGAVPVLSGCTPSHYSEADEKKVEEESRKLLAEWLDTLPDACEIDSVYMFNANEPGQNIYSGYYLSHFRGAISRPAAKRIRLW